MLPFAQAAIGGIGLETLLAVGLECVHNGKVKLIDLLAAMTCHPAKLLDIPGGILKPGEPADLVLFDPNKPWIVTPDKLRSKSKNTPFENRRLQGQVLRTIVGGETVFNRASD